MNEQLKREELRKMIEVNPKSVIGMKCRGFRFDIPQEWDDDRMGKLEGKEGVIWMLSYQSFILIKFEDEFYPYPINEIHNHIILEESKPTFIPTSMPCTEEQFESIKQRLIDGGCGIVCYTFENNKRLVLVNNHSGNDKNIAFIQEDLKHSYNRTYLPEFNLETFLRNCGIELKKGVTQEFPKDDFGVIVQDNAKEILDYLVSKGFENIYEFKGDEGDVGISYFIRKGENIIRYGWFSSKSLNPNFTLSELKSLDTPKVFTCKDLSEGRVACILDDSYENYKKISNYCFPQNTLDTLKRYEHFYNSGYKYLYLAKPNSENYRYTMMTYASNEGLPTQSVKVFLKEIELEEMRLKAAKGVQIKEKSKTASDLQIENLKKILYQTPNDNTTSLKMEQEKPKGFERLSNDLAVNNVESPIREVNLKPKEIKVGDFVRGFKFDGETDSVTKIMSKYIGQIGKVVQINDADIGVEFADGEAWNYPKDQAIEHLVTDFEMDCKQDTKDNINPSHYKRLPKETIERIQDNLTPEEFKGYLKGNIFKYLDRYENKNGVECLKKAQWYLEKLIDLKY